MNVQIEDIQVPETLEYWENWNLVFELLKKGCFQMVPLP
jgi:hypothetical protein